MYFIEICIYKKKHTKYIYIYTFITIYNNICVHAQSLQSCLIL